MRTLESGLSAITAMFLRFWNGNVYEELLQQYLVKGDRRKCMIVLGEVKRSHTVSDGAENRVAIASENDIALLINRPAEV